MEQEGLNEWSSHRTDEYLIYTHIKKKLPVQNERLGSGDDVVLMTRDGDETILSTYVDI